MRFQDTLTALHTATEEITVYASNAYSCRDGVIEPAIGIRAFTPGNPHGEPVIDDTAFMICGDIYVDKSRITTLRDLPADNDHDVFVRLRAVAGWPIATIDIGEYEITGRDMIACDSFGPVMRLDLRRI